MKLGKLLLAGMAAISGLASAADEAKHTQGLPDRPPPAGFWCGVVSSGDDRAYLQLPRDYRPGKEYPLILFFYGRGGTLSDNNLLLDEFASFRRLADAEGYIIAVPDYGSDSYMNEDAEKRTLRLIALLKQKISIDQNRFYAMGVSMGGSAALIFTMRHPEMLAATCSIMPITDFVSFYGEQTAYHQSLGAAFHGSPAENPETYRERSAIHHVAQLKRVPILLVHGRQDALVSSRHSEILSQKLAEAGAARAEFISVPGVGHSNQIICGMEERILRFFSR